MSRSIAGRIKINHYSDLFGGEDNGIVQIPITDLHSFPNHPFVVRDDDDMNQLIQSMKEHGVLNPIIVRVREEAGYEIMYGHRRTHAAKMAGLVDVPAFVKQMDDDEAIISMVDANLQRESILPSEKAFSYKMKLEALKRQGKRSDLEEKDKCETCDQIDHKLKTREEIALNSKSLKKTGPLYKMIFK